MDNNYLFCDSPVLYSSPGNYYIQGCSPRLLSEFISYVDGKVHLLESILFCAYLYNNPVLEKAFLKWASRGIQVSIVTIPLEGYDTGNPQNIKDYYTGNTIYESETKHSLASCIYQRAKGYDRLNYRVYIFPYMYIRSKKVRPFSRGNMPYSLHAKSFYLKFRDSHGTVGLTSSNLAVRDLIKDEVMVLVENDAEVNKEAEHFFQQLINNSYSIKNFKDGSDWFHEATPTEDKKIHSRNIYTAPFYYNSQAKIEERLIGLIGSAKKRVYICAQHICAYNFYFNNAYSSDTHNNDLTRKPGILQAVINKGKEDVEVRCLSQTFVNEVGNSFGCRRPANTAAFQQFIKEYIKNSNCYYAANESLHCKYIIVDNTAVITTCNFTPTQFIYHDKVEINKFEHMENATYKGIHSEVGQFLILKNEKLCESLTKHFFEIYNRPDTFHYKSKPKEAEEPAKVCPKCK